MGRKSTKIEINCKYCGNLFKIKPSDFIRYGKNKYCSRKCYLLEHSKINRICLICGKLFYVKPSIVKKGYGKYCSIKCVCLSNLGKKHPKRKYPNWPIGRYINKGYIIISNKHNKILEHRLIWEKYFGKLKEGMIIHYLNGNRSDNRIENLMAMKRNEHSGIKIIAPFKKRIIELENIIKKLNNQQGIF